METFKNYSSRILFERILLEMPLINLATSKEHFARNTAQVPQLLTKIHSDGNSEHIGGDNYYNHFNGAHIYYRLHNNKPREYSVIDNKHIQTLTSKADGDSSNIHKFMDHHVKTHGVLNSSTDQTEGSKKLWKDHITKTSYDVKSVDGNVERNINKDNLDDLWSKDAKSAQSKTSIRLVKK